MKVIDKLKPVRVFNIKTGQKLTYLIPPKRAIVAAFFQYENNNWEHKTYDSLPRPVIMVNEKTYSCGDWHTERMKNYE